MALPMSANLMVPRSASMRFLYIQGMPHLRRLQSDLPRLTDHQIEMCIVINCRTHTGVIVDELFKCHLPIALGLIGLKALEELCVDLLFSPFPILVLRVLLGIVHS